MNLNDTIYHLWKGKMCGTIFCTLFKEVIQKALYNMLLMMATRRSFSWCNLYDILYANLHNNLYNLRGFKYDKRLKIQAHELEFGDHCKHPLTMAFNLKKCQVSSPRKFKQVSIWLITWKVLKFESVKERKCESSPNRVLVNFVYKNTRFFS